MRLHRVDVSAVEERLVGVGVVAAHALDQVDLAHQRLARPCRFFGRRRGERGSTALERCPRGRLLLHARELGARARHYSTLEGTRHAEAGSGLARFQTNDITPFCRRSKGLREMVAENATARRLRPGPAKLAMFGGIIPRRLPAALPAARGLQGP